MGVQIPRRTRATIQVAAASRFTRRQQPRRKERIHAMRFMLNWLFTSIAIAIATFLVPGIQPSVLPRPGSVSSSWDCS